METTKKEIDMLICKVEEYAKETTNPTIYTYFKTIEKELILISKILYLESSILKKSIPKNPITTSNFRSITRRMEEIYEEKNHDYGNSFDQSLQEFGLTASIVRMGDKINRIKSLSNKDIKVKDESIKDTLLDLANYAIMTILWLNNKDKEG